MRKTHWIRKHLSDSIYNRDKKKMVREYVYDVYSACGRFAILTGTIFRKKVTCKKCLEIMEKSK